MNNVEIQCVLLGGRDLDIFRNAVPTDLVPRTGEIIRIDGRDNPNVDGKMYRVHFVVRHFEGPYSDPESVWLEYFVSEFPGGPAEVSHFAHWMTPNQ